MSTTATATEPGWARGWGPSLLLSLSSASWAAGVGAVGHDLCHALVKASRDLQLGNSGVFDGVVKKCGDRLLFIAAA
jgi:hypothetical protein